MTQELKDKINEYLENHLYLNLGTVSPQGNPMVATLAYASKNSTVYLTSYESSRKVQNIKHNPNVAYTVDEDDCDIYIQNGLQVEGKASIVTDEKELNEIMEIMLDKFPIIEEIPPFPDPAVIKIEPKVIYHLDYSVEFGHRDKVDF